MACDAAAVVTGLDPAQLARVRGYVDEQVHARKTAPFMQVRVLARARADGRVVTALTHSAGDRVPANAATAAKSSVMACDPDTLARIYSMTKPIVSAAAMILVERAQLHLDHPVSRYLPCLENMTVYVSPGVTRPAKTTMTVKHLLTHTAGLTYGFFPDPVADLYNAAHVEFLQTDVAVVKLADDTDEPGALLDMVEKLAAQPLLFDPGTKFNYSFATDVVGCLIEQISGKLLPDFLRDEIFEPLGMQDTGFHVPPEKVSRFSACFTAKSGAAAGNGSFTLSDLPTSSTFLKQRKHLCSGGGGLISTLNDYSKFLAMMLGQGQAPNGRRLLGRKTVEYMMINHLEPGVVLPSPFLHVYAGCGFGIGGSVTVDPAANSLIGSRNQWSWGGAANTYMCVDPEEGIAFVMFTQITPSFDLCQWRRDLTNLIQAALVNNL